MSGKRITDLAPTHVPLSGDEALPIVQNGETRQILIDTLAQAVGDRSSSRFLGVLWGEGSLNAYDPTAFAGNLVAVVHDEGHLLWYIAYGGQWTLLGLLVPSVVTERDLSRLPDFLIPGTTGIVTGSNTYRVYTKYENEGWVELHPESSAPSFITLPLAERVSVPSALEWETIGSTILDWEGTLVFRLISERSDGVEGLGFRILATPLMSEGGGRYVPDPFEGYIVWERNLIGEGWHTATEELLIPSGHYLYRLQVLNPDSIEASLQWAAFFVEASPLEFDPKEPGSPGGPGNVASIQSTLPPPWDLSTEGVYWYWEPLEVEAYTPSGGLDTISIEVWAEPAVLTGMNPDEYPEANHTLTLTLDGEQRVVELQSGVHTSWEDAVQAINEAYADVSPHRNVLSWDGSGTFTLEGLRSGSSGSISVDPDTKALFGFAVEESSGSGNVGRIDSIELGELFNAVIYPAVFQSSVLEAFSEGDQIGFRTRESGSAVYVHVKPGLVADRLGYGTEPVFGTD